MSHSNTPQDHQYQPYVLNVSNCIDEAAICAEVEKLAQPNLSMEISLVGDVDIVLNVKNVTNNCREGFSALKVVDNTSLMGSLFVRELAQENTVQGIVVKRLLDMSSATADEHQLRIYELTLRDLLVRFEVMQGERS